MSQKCLSTSHFSLINLNCQQPLKQSTVIHFWIQIDSCILYALHKSFCKFVNHSLEILTKWFHTLDFTFLFGTISKDSSQTMFSFWEKAIEQLDRMLQCFLQGTIKCFAAILNAGKSLEANLEHKHSGPCRGRLFWRKIVPYTWNNEQHRQTRRKEEFLNSRKTLQEII